MADLAQEVGFSRVWHTMRAAGEREVVVMLAFLLPLGALVMGLGKGCRWKAKARRERAMCFTSQLMVKGFWPLNMKMGDPVMLACIYVDRTPEAAQLEEAVKVMLEYGNLRSRPVKVGFFRGGFAWREIEELEAKDVVEHHNVNGAAGALAEIDRLKDLRLPKTTMGSGRPRYLPLWRLHILHNNVPGGESVVVLRFNHTIGDGMSFVAVATRVLRGLKGEALGLDLGRGAAVVKEGKGHGGGKGYLGYSIGQVLCASWDVMQLSLRPPDTPLPFGHPESGAGAGAGAGARSGTVPYSGRRSTVPMPDIPLGLLKRIKERAGVSVNDVLTGVVSGCVRRYCKANGGGGALAGEGFRSRVLFPVAIPRTMSAEDKDEVLCNKWALVSISLCLEEENPVKRLRRLRELTTSVKHSPLAPLQLAMQDYVMPHLPLSLCRKMALDTMVTHTVTISNVPGPQQPILFAGGRVKRVHMVYPNITPQVGIVSCDGAVGMGFVVDPMAVAGCHTLPVHLVAELRALCEELGVGEERELKLLEREASAASELVIAAAAVTAKRKN